MINNEEREKKPLGRFEIMCEKYIFGTEQERNIILSFLNEEEKQTFLLGVGYYKLFTNEDFYNSVRDCLAERIYNENHK